MPVQKKSCFWNVDRIMHLIIGLAITAILVWLVKTLSGVLLPFFAACFLAYLLKPVVEFNQRWTHIKGRGIPSLLTIIEFSAIIALMVYLFMPSVLKDIHMLGDILKDISSGHREIPRDCKPFIDLYNNYFANGQFAGLLTNSHLETFLNKGTSFIEESLDFLFGVLEWMLMIIYVIFILIYYPEISRGFRLIFPGKYRRQAMVVVKDVQVNMNHYFRGQGLVALCAAVFYCVGFSIVGLPLAIPMGLLVGILYMIPYFQYITLIPIAIICFIYSLGGGEHFMAEFGKCLLVYVVSQSVCDYIITPHVMGKEMGMNPAIILLSLSVWGSLLGIIGMIIALPVSALIMSYYERYISNSSPEETEEIENTENNT